MSNPLIDRMNKAEEQSPAYWRAKKQEKRTAKSIGGHTVSGSGSKTIKGDVRKRGIARIEAKSTSADSFRVTKEMLDKIKNAALGCDEIPAIVIDFLSPTGDVANSVACIPLESLIELIERSK